MHDPSPHHDVEFSPPLLVLAVPQFLDGHTGTAELDSAPCYPLSIPLDFILPKCESIHPLTVTFRSPLKDLEQRIEIHSPVEYA